MKQESELGRLENFVNSLLARYNALQEDNARLTQDVQERDEIIEDLRDNLAQLESERNEISNRVGGIIQQIEEWEKSGAGAVGLSTTGENSEGRVQGSLFSIEPGGPKSAEND